MLGWFTRHQKSLMLVLLTPALIGMGITGAIMSVMQDQGATTAGYVFGKRVTDKEFARFKNNWQRMYRSPTDDQLWRDYATLRA